MATAHASCPECLRPVEASGVACPQCGTTYHADCRPAGGCVVAGCGRAERPAAAGAEAPVPLRQRVLAAAPDALFVLWFALCVLGCLTGNYMNSGSVCDPVLAAAVLAGLLVYPGRALRARNAPIRRGLVAAFLMCVSMLLVLVISAENRYGGAEPPEPMRILGQLMSSRADRFAWDPTGARFYEHGPALFNASMSCAGLALLAAVYGMLRDRPRTRAAAAAIAALGVAGIVSVYR